MLATIRIDTSGMHKSETMASLQKLQKERNDQFDCSTHAPSDVSTDDGRAGETPSPSAKESRGPLLRRLQSFRLASSRQLTPESSELYQEHKRKELLAKIRAEIDSLTDQEKDLRKRSRVHCDRAKARMNQCRTGAIISMRKVHKLQQEQSALMVTIGYLRELESKLELDTDCDLAHLKNFELHANTLLSPKQETVPDLSDEELLAQLAQQQQHSSRTLITLPQQPQQ